jgi:hypothetical protein
MADDANLYSLRQRVLKLRERAAGADDISYRIRLLAEVQELADKLRALGHPLEERTRR